MTKRRRNELVNRITELLTEGPETGEALAASIGLDGSAIRSVLHRMRTASPKLPKRIYIVDYRYDGAGGTREYPRAVFALGDKPDKRKPKAVPNRVRVTKWYRKRVAATRLNSIFNVGRMAHYIATN